MRSLTERGSETGPRRETANANDKEESLSESDAGLTAIWTVGSGEGEDVGVGRGVLEGGDPKDGEGDGDGGGVGREVGVAD